MLKYILIGLSYALAAGLQPGPLQAFFLAKVSQQGWKRTLPAAFAPLVSDGPIALVAILLVGVLPEAFWPALQFGGGLLLVIFAWKSFQSWRRAPGVNQKDAGAAPGTVFQAALVNLLNPNPYLGWSLVMGPAVLTAWSEGPHFAFILLLVFYLTMISTSLLIIYLMGQAVLLGPDAGRTMNLISALLFAGFGLYFLYQATNKLTVLL